MLISIPHSLSFNPSVLIPTIFRGTGEYVNELFCSAYTMRESGNC